MPLLDITHTIADASFLKTCAYALPSVVAITTAGSRLTTVVHKADVICKFYMYSTLSLPFRIV